MTNPVRVVPTKLLEPDLKKLAQALVLLVKEQQTHESRPTKRETRK